MKLGHMKRDRRRSVKLEGGQVLMGTWVCHRYFCQKFLFHECGMPLPIPMLGEMILVVGKRVELYRVAIISYRKEENSCCSSWSAYIPILHRVIWKGFVRRSRSLIEKQKYSFVTNEPMASAVIAHCWILAVHTSISTTRYQCQISEQSAEQNAWNNHYWARQTTYNRDSFVLQTTHIHRGLANPEKDDDMIGAFRNWFT